MKLKTIRAKKFLYEDFLKFTYFYFTKYNLINSIANRKFSLIEKKQRLKLSEFEYSIQFLNIDLKGKNRKNSSFLNSINQCNKEDNEKIENYDEPIYISSSKSSQEENININNNKSNENEKISKENLNESRKEEQNKFLKKKRKMKKIKNKYKKLKNNNNNNSELNKNENDKLDKNNIEIKSKSNFKSSENDSIMNNNKKTKVDKNINFENTKQKINYTEEKPSKNILIRKSNDEEYKDFKKNLNDYLLRIIGEKREKEFLDKILPESVEIMKKLFKKNNDIAPKTIIPIYRNEYLEFSLIIKNKGQIEKKILYIKE